MKSSAHIETTYDLTLTDDEAQWLQAYIQNPHSDEETELDSVMRQRFFNAIQDAKL